MRTRLPLALGLLIVTTSPALRAQVPLGSEFRVNPFTASLQLRPSVAAHASGAFVVVWESFGEDGSGLGVFGQRYDASGTHLGSEFRVNSYTSAYQRAPAVAADASGGFVVVRASFGQDGRGYGVLGPLAPRDLGEERHLVHGRRHADAGRLHEPGPALGHELADRRSEVCAAAPPALATAALVEDVQAQLD